MCFRPSDQALRLEWPIAMVRARKHFGLNFDRVETIAARVEVLCPIRVLNVPHGDACGLRPSRSPRRPGRLLQCHLHALALVSRAADVFDDVIHDRQHPIGGSDDTHKREGHTFDGERSQLA